MDLYLLGKLNFCCWHTELALVILYILTLQPFIHEQIDIKFTNIHIDEGIRLKV